MTTEIRRQRHGPASLLLDGALCRPDNMAT